LTQIEAQFQRAMGLCRRGESAQAQIICRDILNLQPAHPGACYLVGVMAGQSRDWEGAAEWIGKAIEADPGNADAHCDRGVAFKALRQWDAAILCYDRAIAIRAEHPEAYCNRGNVYYELKCLDAALADYQRAIDLRPDYATAHYNRGVVRADLRQWDAALSSYDRAIASRADYAAAHCNRGVVLERLGQFDAALASYDAAIAIHADFAQAHSNRGNVLRQLGRLEAALAACNRALAIQPENAEAHCNRGATFSEANRLDEAIADYDRAIAKNPDYATAHYNRACAQLALGDFEHGWVDYEWRRRKQEQESPGATRTFLQPLWQGEESIAGKTILLHAEQGLGDTIQFCRYAKRVALLGAKVILEVHAPLVGLLGSLEGVSQLLGQGDALPAFDYHCPLMSLPLALKTRLPTVPAHVPYLTADAARTLVWRQRLGEKSNARVGLVWSGGSRPNMPELRSVNNRRNIPLAELAPLRNDGIDFYSLQKGQPAESELAAVQACGWSGPAIIDLTAQLNDFADTAALIEQLDLVITVDTSTAHLAGALGKPLWILNRFDSCWRWLLDRDDSPWYPTARLYRQERLGDWSAVLEKVRLDLRQWASAQS
jgi:tetratricopeptide (TPR) repeat protein